MRMLLRLLSVAVVLFGAGIPQSIEAQTPLPKNPPVLPKIPPKLVMRWLDTLTVNPTPVNQERQIVHYAM